MEFRLAVICLFFVSSAIDISFGEQADGEIYTAENQLSHRIPREVIRGEFHPPHATVEALQPKGFQVYIPDEPGIKLFAFHGRLNEPLDLLEAGEFSFDIQKSKNGRWTYKNSKVKLNIGDTINFWTMVHHSFDGEEVKGYRIDDETFTVTSFANNQGGPVQTTTGFTPSMDSQTTRPTGRPCTPSVTTISNSQPVCSGNLIFEETFNNPSSSKFTPEVAIADQPDYPFVVYMKNEENLFYKDGSVVIRPQLYEHHFDSVRGELDIIKTCTAPADSELCHATGDNGFILPPVISAKVTTKNTFSFTYGRIEIIAKVPTGDWIYPEIQLEPKDKNYGEKFYASGIMRIALTKGNQKNAYDLQGGVIMDSNSAVRGTHMKLKSGMSPWSDNFHNYTMIWGKDRVIVSVDGEEYGTIAPVNGRLNRGTSGTINPAEELWQTGTNMAPFDKPFYISLGIAVGGNEFEDRPDKPWSNESPRARLKFWKKKKDWFPTWQSESTLQVNSVRVYAL